jgi:hypothetical protein
MALPSEVSRNHLIGERAVGSTVRNQGAKIAQDFVYTVPDHGTPDANYQKKHAEICKAQALLGGYRLAAYLNATFVKH